MLKNGTRSVMINNYWREFSGGNCPGGSCPRDNHLGGNCLGGGNNNPGGIFLGAGIVRGQLPRGRKKMSGTPVKNHVKKPQDFLKEAETNSCEITRR